MNNKQRIILVTVMIVLLSTIVNAPPPTPHNVKGRVFQSDGSTGVANGIPVTINDTASGDFVTTRTYAPPIPQFLGSYSATISGNDDDNIIVTAWNSTHYGTNTSNLLSTTTDVNVVLDTARPSETNVTILTPTNNSLKNTSISFNVTANISIIGGTDPSECNATIYFSNDLVMNISSEDTFIHNLGDMSLGSSTTTTWNITGIREGSSNITVKAKCSSDGENFEHEKIEAISITIEDTTPPMVNLESPENKSWSTNKNLTLKYNVTDISNIKNCGLYFDGILDHINNNIKTDKSQNFTINETEEGNHTWFVSCDDNGSNNNMGTSKEWLIMVDTILPNVTLISPENNTVRENNTVLFEYNVTDENYVENCSLIINGLKQITNKPITKNITQNFTKTLSGGDYTWLVNCSDSANNIGSSTFRFLNITDSDLKINSSDIMFSNDNPVENENITINVTIYNTGNEDATNVIIQFFDGNPYNNGIQINSDKTVDISINSSVTVNESIIAKIGLTEIFVVVDPPLNTNGSIPELNESNNIANKTFLISPYHVFYGGVGSDIILDNVQNFSVYLWINESTVSGNIFTVDSDSDIDWNNLSAIGVNISNENISNDFYDIDVALNMTNLIDSINRTFTFNSTPKNITTFTAFNRVINTTPFINSTNNSNFITGIMWDMSDKNPGQYNSSQDLVFITSINANKQGAYGIYDYEIKVPARLREYILPDNDHTITFYAEVT